MNYPIWNLINTGGGLLIAIIAIFHVVISHLAVGGGLFLVLTERKAIKSNDGALMRYVKSHTKFFLLLTMVAGGLTGVGIWFIIALVHPSATSILIHNFVFGWAIEWVFFIGEIVALLIYYYRFDQMKPRDHLIIGWLYFIFAWLSLFIINGILGFMLTPGQWLETGSFWHGFFNPSFFPALVFRTCIAVVFAGVFGLVTGSFMKDAGLRKRIFSICAQWMYLPVVIFFFSGLLYTRIIDNSAFNNLFHFNQMGVTAMRVLLLSSLLLFTLGLFTLFRLPGTVQKIGSFVMVLIVFGWMSGFEYSREVARKPFVLYNVMYSNGITASDVPEIQKSGILPAAKWTKIKEVTEENKLEAGAEIYKLHCLACHTLEGYNQVKNKIDHLTERGLIAQLTGQGKVNSYMPPFMGTEKEKEALAAYLFQEVSEKETIEEKPFTPSKEELNLPPFDENQDDYVLLVWNDLGMHCISDNDGRFVFLPPANTLFAQLFKRGEKPEVITQGVKLVYEVEDGYQNPAQHVDFWKFEDKIFGVDLEEGVGLSGKGVNGELDPQAGYFVATMIPVVPYRDDQTFNPYPLFNIKAIDEDSGEVLISTRAVAPTSTEMGCRNCHGGGWKFNSIAGVADETAENILAVHDKYNNTTLLNDANEGKPQLCQSCHPDPAVGAPGKPGHLNLSAAIHGFHANYLSGDLYAEACNMCHPSDPAGKTRCFRGRHDAIGLTCTECHGTIEDHALSLLKPYVEQGNKDATRMADKLNTIYTDSYESVKGRQPWLQEPDCTSCHTKFDIINDGWPGTAFNRWVEGFSDLYRNRTDNHGVMCSACHGSTHAVYPANNIYGADRDNIQPLQYQGNNGAIGAMNNCQICHTKKMPYSGHHRNMLMNPN